MHPLRANTWGTAALLGIHVITATRTILLVGIVTMVVAVTAAIATKTVTPMAETEIGVIVEALLLLVVVDTPLTIGVVGATPAAHPLEEVALHLVVGVVVVAQETMTRQPLQEVLLLLQHLLLNTRGGEEFLTPLIRTGGMWSLFVCFSSALFIFFLFNSFFLRHLSCLSFYLTVSLYVLSLKWPWTWSSLSWACKMCKDKICVEEKVL